MSAAAVSPGANVCEATRAGFRGSAGSAKSDQRVPRKASSTVPPLSVVIMTVVPPGDVSVTSRSAGKACLSAVIKSTRAR